MDNVEEIRMVLDNFDEHNKEIEEKPSNNLLTNENINRLWKQSAKNFTQIIYFKNIEELRAMPVSLN